MLRKPHRKSRLGCKTCRTRRVKCDEIRPFCGNCTKHGVSCDFAPVISTYSKSSQPVEIPRLAVRRPVEGLVLGENWENNTSTTANATFLTEERTLALSVSTPDQTLSFSSSSSSSPGSAQIIISPFQAPVNAAVNYTSNAISIPVTIGTPADRLVELKLLHHFTEMTHLTHDHPEVQVFADWKIRVAFSSPSLMDALLAFSAFHLQFKCVSDREISHLPHLYMLRALKGHSAEIRNIGANAEAAFATSTFVALHSTMARSFGDLKDGPPLHWFQPWQGIRTIVQIGWDYIIKSSIEAHINVPHHPINKIVYDKTPGAPLLPFNFLLHGLSNEAHKPDVVECYELTVAQLSWLYTNREFRNIIRFAALTSKTFMKLLSGSDPRILTMVGYFFVLLHRADAPSMWWLKSTVQIEFKMIMKLLPVEWWPQMQWAMEDFEPPEQKDVALDCLSGQLSWNR